MRSFLALPLTKLRWNYQVMRMRLTIHVAHMGEIFLQYSLRKTGIKNTVERSKNGLKHNIKLDVRLGHEGMECLAWFTI